MKPSDKIRKINNLYTTSLLYEILRYIDKAIELCQKALDIPDTNDYQSLWQINNRLGYLYSKSKLYDDSLNSYNQAAKNIIQLNDYKKYAYSKFKAGEIYEKLKSNEQAITSYKEAKSSIEKAGTLTIEDGELLGNILYSLSNVLRKDKQFDEAMSYANKCLEVFSKIESLKKVKLL
jgi:tetratricopeptide (TPR) repeat protein